MNRIIILSFDSNPTQSNPTIQFMKNSIDCNLLSNDTPVELVALKGDKSWFNSNRKYDASIFNEMCSVAMRYISDKANIIKSKTEYISDIKFDFSAMGGFVIVSDGDDFILNRIVSEYSDTPKVKW